jgi:hypothetical protein
MSNSPVLRRMAQIATEIEDSGGRDPLTPARAHIQSSYTEAIDTVRKLL